MHSIKISIISLYNLCELVEEINALNAWFNGIPLLAAYFAELPTQMMW